MELLGIALMVFLLIAFLLQVAEARDKARSEAARSERERLRDEARAEAYANRTPEQIAKDNARLDWETFKAIKSLEKKS